jgi:hypothetical protein
MTAKITISILGCDVQQSGRQIQYNSFIPEPDTIEILILRQLRKIVPSP